MSFKFVGVDLFPYLGDGYGTANASVTAGGPSSFYGPYNASGSGGSISGVEQKSVSTNYANYNIWLEDDSGRPRCEASGTVCPLTGYPGGPCSALIPMGKPAPGATLRTGGQSG
ncbi:hypothetical protein GCM10009565_37090 [Amycolatopsis albidoflavus]